MNMKKILLVASCFMLFAQLSKAQIATSNVQRQTQLCGLYMTEDDYIKDELSYKVNRSMNPLHVFSVRGTYRTAKIENAQGKFNFKPGEFFGYFEKGDKYIYYASPDKWGAKGFFKVEKECVNFTFYSQQEANSSGASRTVYFYSLGIGKPIKWINSKYLVVDFPAQQEQILLDFKRLDEVDKAKNFYLEQLLNLKTE